MEHNFYKRTLLGKAWTVILGVTWVVLIAAVLYESFESYKSGFMGLSITISGFVLLLIS